MPPQRDVYLAYSMTARRSSPSTESPALTRMRVTSPALVAGMTVSCDTWHQGKYGEEGMPNGTKGRVVRRACQMAPRDVW